MRNCEFKRTAIGKGIHYTVCRNKRYKLNRMSVYFLLPHTEESAAANGILSCLLTKTNANYPTITAFSHRLAMLYGADLTGDFFKSGDSFILCFSVECLDDRYAITPEKITEQAAEMLCDSLLQPHLQDGSFPKDAFLLEQQFLLDSALAAQNNKRKYAMQQLLSLLFEGEPAGISKFGSPRRIADLTPDDALNAWKNLLATASIEILFTGSGHEEEAKEIFANRFSKIQREKVYRHKVTKHKPSLQVRRQTEEMHVKQAKLVMGYTLKEKVENRAALRLFNCILGGSASSRFFTEIREKESLCYYCASRFYSDAGVMVVDSGVEGDKTDKTEQAVDREIASLAKGTCTQKEFDAARLYLLNGLKSVTDSVGGMDSWNFSRILLKSGSLKSDKLALSQVQREEIAQIAAALQKDSVFLLKGTDKSEGGEEE